MQQCLKPVSQQANMLFKVPPHENQKMIDSPELGQTLFQCIFSMDCALAIGCYKLRVTQSPVITCILLHSSGKPYLLPSSIAKYIINDLNNTQESGPYWYVSLKGFILFNFKVNSSGFQRTDFLTLKIQKIQSILLSTLQFYGIITNFSHQNDAKRTTHKRIKLLVESLKTKRKITDIVKSQLKIKAQKKQLIKSKGQKNDVVFISEANLVPPENPLQLPGNPLPMFEKVYSYFTSITPGQKQKDIDKSLKFEMIRNNYNLVVEKIEQEENTLLYKKTQHTQSNLKLVKKTVKSNLEDKMKNKASLKLKREINLIKNIKYGKQYFLKYYFPKQNNVTQNSQLYMQYLHSNLAFGISNQVYGMKDLIQKFKQIVEGISMLHKSGIVHRDLKLENIMIVQNRQSEQDPSVKIIDFSDSAFISEKYTSELSNSLGSSLPYSPFQCVYDCQYGVNDPAIDLWSLGILLYEFIYNDIPCLNYHNTTMDQFLQGISGNKLCINMPKIAHGKGFFKYLQQFTQRIIQNCLIFIHYQRMETDLIKQITVLILDYIDKVDYILTSQHQD